MRITQLSVCDYYLIRRVNSENTDQKVRHLIKFVE